MQSHRWILIAVLLLTPAVGAAQAWTPLAGEGTIWMAAQALHVDAHLPYNGKVVKDLEVKSQSLTLGLEYGVTDRLAVEGSVPYVRAKLLYTEHLHGGTWDDYSAHGTVTDLRLEARYKAVDGPVVLTPAISALIPTHHYEVLGHAAPALGLHEYAAGFDAGYHAVPISPSLLLQGRFRYTYVQRVEEVKIEHLNGDAEADYLLNTRITLSATARWQRTHGGLDLPLPRGKDDPHALDHDQLGKVNFWGAAAGITYGLTSDVDVSLSWATVLSGINTHRFQAWTLGMGWRFKRAAANP